MNTNENVKRMKENKEIINPSFNCIEKILQIYYFLGSFFCDHISHLYIIIYSAKRNEAFTRLNLVYVDLVFNNYIKSMPCFLDISICESCMHL